MTTYPESPDRRFPALVADLSRRLLRVEQRTRNLDSGTLVQTVTGTIDPAYVSGDPNVTITGSGALTGPYQTLASYTPVANDPVLLIPSGATYVVAGKLT